MGPLVGFAVGFAVGSTVGSAVAARPWSPRLGRDLERSCNIKHSRPSGGFRGAWQMPTPPASDQEVRDAALARELAADVSQDLSHHRRPSYRDAPRVGWPHDGPRYGGRGDGRGAPPPDYYYHGSRAPPRDFDDYYGQY